MLVYSYYMCTHLSTFIYVRLSRDRYIHITYKLDSRQWQSQLKINRLADLNLIYFHLDYDLNTCLLRKYISLIHKGGGMSFWIKNLNRNVN